MRELVVVRIEAVWLTHPGSGHLLLRTLRDLAAIQLSNVLREWLR